jgi:hypothetical protein
MLERSKNLFHSQTEEEVVFGFGLFWARRRERKQKQHVNVHVYVFNGMMWLFKSIKSHSL